MSLTRREFNKNLLVALAGASALGGSVPTSSLAQPNISKTIDDLILSKELQRIYKDPYIQNGELKDGALLLALNLRSTNPRSIGYNQQEFNGEMYRHSYQSILFPPSEPDVLSYYKIKLPELAQLFGAASPEDLIWPKDITDSAQIKKIMDYLGAKLALQPNETLSQRIKELTKRSKYLQLLEREADKGNVLAKSILFRENMISLEAALYGTTREIDAAQLNEWYGLNRWDKGFKFVTLGAQIIPGDGIGKPVSNDLSKGYVQIKYELSIPSRPITSSERWYSDIKIPLSDFSAMIKGTKYEVRDYREAVNQLQDDMNSGKSHKTDPSFLKVMNEFYVRKVNEIPSAPAPKAGTSIREFRGGGSWAERVGLTNLGSDASPYSVKITIHEPNKI